MFLRKTWFKLFLIFCPLVFAFPFIHTINIAENRDENSNPENQSAVFDSPQANSVNLGKLGLSFIPNKGQHPGEVRFSSQATGHDLFFTSDQVVFNLKTVIEEKSPPQANEIVNNTKTGVRLPKYANDVIRLKLLNSNQKTEITGEEEKAGKFNIFKGSDAGKWQTGLSAFGKIRYREVYPGIDLIFYGNEGNIQYDFIVAPEADPNNIGFSFSGVDTIKKDTQGNLVLAVGKNEVSLSRPVVYQPDGENNRREIPGEFQINKNNTVGFKIGEYDRSKTLVIDPVFSYSSFLGGHLDDVGNSVAVDDQGNAYVTGSTLSMDFPVSASGRQPTPNTTDIFVTKLNPQGTDFVYSTVIGSNGDDTGFDIALDSSGSAYVTGEVGNYNFPQYKPLNYYSTILKTTEGVNDWQTVSGINTGIFRIAADPQNPAAALAGTEGGIYKTVDSGANWIPVNTGLGSNLPQVSPIVYNPHNPSVVLAGTGSKIYKSTDGGESWTLMSQDLGQDGMGCIVFDPVNPQTIYRCQKRLYKSTDGGASWTLSNNDLTVSNVYTVLVDPTNPAIVYAATSNGVFKSADYGQNWISISNGITGNFRNIFQLLFHPGNTSTIYAGALGTFYKTVDGGSNWQALTTSLTSASMNSLVMNPNNPSIFYAAISHTGILRSTDGGVTWSSFSNNLPIPPAQTSPNVRSVTFLSDGNTMLTGSERLSFPGGFVFKLNPAGDGFAYSTFFGNDNSSIAVDGSGRAYVAGKISADFLPLVNPLRSYSGRDDGFVAIIEPDGRNLAFSTYLGGTENEILSDVAVDPGGNIYLTGQTPSPDFPVVNAFQPQKRGQQDAFITKLSPNGAGIVYSSYFGGGGLEAGNAVFADSQGNAYFAGSTSSTDLPTGASPAAQTAAGGGLDVFVAKFDPAGTSLLYSTYIGGGEVDIANDIAVDQSGRIVVAGQSESIDFPVLRSLKSKVPFTKSASRGNRWRNDAEGINARGISAIAIHPQNTAILLAATDKGVFRSSDYGENWTKSSNGLQTDQVSEIVFNPANPSVVYAGTSPNPNTGQGGGVYKSNDGGANWTAINNGIASSFQQVSTIAVNPSNTNIVYAGTNGFNTGYPLYKSTNGGASWTAVGVSTLVNISDIKIDPTNPSVVYATSTHLVKNAFRSSDGGNFWQIIGQGIPDSLRVRSIEIDRTNPSRLYLGTDGGIYYSSNSGGLWQSALDLPNASAQITADPVNSSTLYAGTQSGLYISNDQGVSWTPNNGGLIYKSLGVIAIDRTNPGVMYAAARPDSEYDAFVTKISPAGNAFDSSCLFGSSGDLSTFPLDYAYGLALDGGGRVYTTGYTRVSSFPTTPGAFSNHFNGYFEAFVTKLDDSRKITGQVSTSGGAPVDDVLLELTGANDVSTITGLDGKYKINARQNGGFVLTPHKVGFSFSPPNVVINDLNGDTTANFTAVSSTRTISGQITDGQNPVAGVTISLSGSQNQTVQTNAAGFYTFNVANGGSYIVTPAKPGYIFTPEARQFNNITENRTADFTAGAGFIISGRVLQNGAGLSSIPVNLTGTQSANVLTDSGGNFSFSAAAGGSYTVTPLSDGFGFTPASASISNLNSPQNLTFNAIAPNKANGKIAYASYEIINNVANLDIFIYSPTGRTNISNNPASDINPVWSPDGRKIAFSSNRDGNWEIYVMNANGGNQIRLTSDFAVDKEPSWSADGSKIAFVRTPSGSSSAEIYTVNSDGSNLARLTDNIWFESSPAWSPDDGEIAFVSEQDGNAEIYVMAADGSNRRRLTNNSAADGNPAWSPDGTKIAFDNGSGSNKEIYVMQRDGSSPVRLTQNNGEDKAPSFSPDGTKIVFVGIGFNLCSVDNLFVMNSDGGGRTELISCGSLNTDPNWQSEVTTGSTQFDFDGDSKTDISIYRPSVGEWWITHSSTNQTVAAQFGTATDKIVPADFTGDGKTDIALWRESSGEWFVLRSEDNSFYAFPFGTAGDIPAPGDFDGDGRADAAVFRPSTGIWYILRSSDGGVSVQLFGTVQDNPVSADYDGDGKTDIAIYRSSVGEWWYRKSSNDQVVALQFGSSEDKPVQGDFTGDGKADVAFYRPSTGFWYVLRSEDVSFYAFPFGIGDDIPTPGDYDGDGRFDAAVFRPANATWYLLRSTAGFSAVQFGTASDQPVPSAFIP